LLKAQKLRKNGGTPEIENSLTWENIIDNK
jgi:hypothetical protein